MGLDCINQVIGGEERIRTSGTLARTTVFETAAIDHSATSPHRVKGACIDNHHRIV